MMRPAFVSLGAGVHQLPLIEAAKDAGYFTVAVDRNPEAPGLSAADHALPASILQPSLIRRKLLELNLSVRAVASRSYGKALISTAALAESLGVEGPGMRAVRFFQNKARYKAELSHSGVLVPAAHDLTSATGREAFLNSGSVVVRPARGSGKLGVRLLVTPRQKQEWLMSMPRDTLAEDQVRGTEITVLAACKRGSVETLLVTSKRISKTEPLFAEILHRYPADIPHHVHRDIETVLAQVAAVSGMVSGPLVAEFIFDGERLWLVEAAPEIGGEFLADWMFPALTGESYFKWLVSLLAAKAQPVPLARGAAVIRYILQRDGVFQGMQWNLLDPGMVHSRLLAAPGQRVSTQRGNLDRLAAFCLYSSTIDPHLTERADRIAERMDIRYETETQNDRPGKHTPEPGSMGYTLQPAAFAAGLPG